mmetsp:Transcript_13570/g.28896  ORF Transcript_13570/g.28896 Transcript_13570/m.28896 type:complete len:285 (-) Transcript_13570:105-959(-)
MADITQILAAEYGDGSDDEQEPKTSTPECAPDTAPPVTSGELAPTSTCTAEAQEGKMQEPSTMAKEERAHDSPRRRRNDISRSRSRSTERPQRERYGRERDSGVEERQRHSGRREYGGYRREEFDRRDRGGRRRSPSTQWPGHRSGRDDRFRRSPPRLDRDSRRDHHARDGFRENPRNPRPRFREEKTLNRVDRNDRWVSESADEYRRGAAYHNHREPHHDERGNRRYEEPPPPRPKPVQKWGHDKFEEINREADGPSDRSSFLSDLDRRRAEQLKKLEALLGE